MSKLILLFMISCYNSGLLNKDKAFTEEINYYINQCNNGAVNRLINRYRNGNIPFDLNLLDETGQAPIHHATSLGQIDIIRELVNNGASLELQNALGETPLHIATEMGYEEVTNFLLSSNVNANINDTFNTNALIANLVTGNCSLEILKSLIKTIDINAPIGDERKTPLHFAGEKGKLDCMEFLVSKDADINKKDMAGNTPIHLLIKSFDGNIDAQKLYTIIEFGKFDVRLLNSNFKTVQHLAVERGIEPLISLFHQLGLDRAVIENSTPNLLARIIRSHGNLELDETRKDLIQENLDVLHIKEDDFNQGDRSFLNILAASLYAKWTQDNLTVSLPERIELEENMDQNEIIDLTALLAAISNIKTADLDQDLKSTHSVSTKKLIESLVKINANSYTNPQICRVAKMKLKKLCSIFPNVSDENKLFTINTLLRQFNYCAVGSIAGLDQVLLILDTQFERTLEKEIHILLERDRKNALLEAIRQVLPHERQQVHMDHLVITDFSDEFKIILEFNDPFNLNLNINNINYDKNAVRNEFYRRYTAESIINLIKEKYSTNAKIYNYLKELSGDKNINLTQDDELFFDADCITRDYVIKGLLIHMGYLKKFN